MPITIRLKPSAAQRATAALKVLHRINADALLNDTSPAHAPFQSTLPESNLYPEEMFKKANKKLGTPAELTSGAMFFYTNMVRMPRTSGKNNPQRRTGPLVYGALAVGLAFPKVRQAPFPTKEQRVRFRNMWTKNIPMAWTGLAVSKLVSVKKMEDHFLVNIPVFMSSDTQLAALCAFYKQTGGDEGNVLLSEAPSLQVGFIPADQLKPTGGSFDQYLPRLKALPNAGVEIRKLSGNWVFSLVLPFTEREVSVMTQTPWMQIRPIDFYGLIRTWSDGRAGSIKTDPPIYGKSLNRIASTLPANGVPRVSKDLGIMVDELSVFWALPKDDNRIGQFDSELAQHLRRPDGTFCAVPKDANEKVNPPPKQGLVFVDWINLKMAYANSEGRLEIKDLSRVIAANATHYRKVLNYAWVDADMTAMVKRIQEMCDKTGANIKLDDIVRVAGLILREPEMEGNTAEDITWLHLYKFAARIPECANYVKAFQHILSYADTSVENLYESYSFRVVSNIIAQLKILNEWGPKVEELKAIDNERRKAYTEQGLDPNYQLEDAPYFQEAGPDGTGGRSLLPHQTRSANRLRQSPKFAIIAVDAGGGKTITGIYDILKEMGKNNIRRVLIMCPAHLVAQYVKEFLYCTNGRVNVIAVNSYTLKKHGVNGLREMLRRAPPNTVVVTDYNLANSKSKAPAVGYGVAPTRVYPVVEMLRAFQFDYVYCDESHFLKNVTSRQAAVSRLISDIPYKRLASGTLTPNSITDLVQQVALLDPTIFPRGEFLEKYALEWNGDGKVTEWKPGAGAMIMAAVKNHVVWCQAKRKEWAALLPPLKEQPYFTDLSPTQLKVYKTVLNQIVEEIEKTLREGSSVSKALRLALTGVKAKPKVEGDEDDGDEGEGGEEGGEEEDVEAIDFDALLKPYLARLERFLVAPAADPLGNIELTGKERISPKVQKVADICYEHFAKGIKGKILIFTNYVESAKAIYDGFPEDLRRQTIYYTAGEKEKCGAQFERDDAMQIMVGVEQSMNTGLNLQFCSRLIRIDSVWTPGSLEQGNSRIQRPNIKVAEERQAVYIDWVLTNNSIDITKYAYLLQKRVTIGKFEEAGNPRFDKLTVPPAFPMSLDLIRDSSSKDEGFLVDYFASYKDFNYATFAEFAEYKAKNQQDIDPVTKTVKMTNIGRAANLAGSGLMYRLPYVPGTELYAAKDLGLVRYDAYLNVNEEELEENAEDDDGNNPGEGDDDFGGKTGQRLINAQELEKVKGLDVHTEYGDGQIVGVAKKALKIDLSSGERVIVSKLATFVIGRAQTNNHDQRELLLRQVGDIPFDKPLELQVKDAKAVRIPKNAPKAPDVISVNLALVITNDIPGIEFYGAEKNAEGTVVMEALGFKRPAPYYYAKLQDAQHLRAQMVVWHKAGFNVHPKFNEACRNLYESLLKARKNAVNLVGIASQAQLTNFFRLEIKPVGDRMTICPYPMVENNSIYLVLPVLGHPGSAAAIGHKASGVKWVKANVDDIRSMYFRNLQGLNVKMNEILKQGISVTNLKELKSQANKLHRRNPGLVEGIR